MLIIIRSHSLVVAWFLPTALVWPFSAAIMSGVFPTASTLLTWALWLSRSWRHSTWSVKAAACSGVLQRYRQSKAHFPVIYWSYTSCELKSPDFIPVFTVFGIDNGRAKSVYQHLSCTFIVMDPVKTYIFHQVLPVSHSLSKPNTAQLKILHSTVEGAERIAFCLVKNLMFQQHLHTGIMTCSKKALTTLDFISLSGLFQNIISSLNYVKI